MVVLIGCSCFFPISEAATVFVVCVMLDTPLELRLELPLELEFTVDVAVPNWDGCDAVVAAPVVATDDFNNVPML